MEQCVAYFEGPLRAKNSPEHGRFPVWWFRQAVPEPHVDIIKPKAADGSSGQVGSPTCPIEQRDVGFRPEDGQRNARQTDAGANIKQSRRGTSGNPTSGKGQRIAEVACPDSVRFVGAKSAGNYGFFLQPHR